jgi:hypothetical protein
VQETGAVILRNAKGRDHAERDRQQPDGCDNGGNHRADIGQHGTGPWTATPARRRAG